MPTLRTPRLLLREWNDDDLDPFAALNTDENVMRHFPSTLSRNESDALAMRIRAHFSKFGFGLWALEIPSVTPFAGIVGLTHVPFDAPFTPAIEIGWRLAQSHWGHGYATEAARLALRHAFFSMKMNEVVAFTTPRNTASIRVMEKIGMLPDPEGAFDHPRIPVGHPLKRHVLYRARP